MLKNGSKKGFLLAKIDFAFLPTTFIVYRVLVHYRVGNLEILLAINAQAYAVHYRIGSLMLLLNKLKTELICSVFLYTNFLYSLDKRKYRL